MDETCLKKTSFFDYRPLLPIPCCHAGRKWGESICFYGRKSYNNGYGKCFSKHLEKNITNDIWSEVIWKRWNSRGGVWVAKDITGHLMHMQRCRNVWRPVFPPLALETRCCFPLYQRPCCCLLLPLNGGLLRLKGRHPQWGMADAEIKVLSGVLSKVLLILV